VVGMVIVSHGELATGLLDAIRMIAGNQQGLTVVTLMEGEAPEHHEAEVATAIEEVDQGEGVLILADLFGATPFNVSGRLAMTKAQVEVITGFNLPMVLEVCLRREGMDLDEVVAMAKQAGQDGVRVLSESLQE
jgi:PTS system mannose-specific IIA component